MLAAISETASKLGTNVNLGIVLLLGPLVAADRVLSADTTSNRTKNAWMESITRQLADMDDRDGQNVFQAIAASSAGGLGTVDELDVHSPQSSINVLAAMKLAADRDLIARQYATSFADVIDQVAPRLHASILKCGDVLQGICLAHVELMAWVPDSLIARKCGKDAAVRVQELARSVGLQDRNSVERLDAELRSDDHVLNPGTTADLIAAGLYLLLRSLPETPYRTTDNECT
jgi:triphosphoribosyl-dephospho-CoA synthase